MIFQCFCPSRSETISDALAVEAPSAAEAAELFARAKHEGLWHFEELEVATTVDGVVVEAVVVRVKFKAEV
jgi:hypothetical protein